jgi:hypothetical protein
LPDYSSLPIFNISVATNSVFSLLKRSLQALKPSLQLGFFDRQTFLCYVYNHSEGFPYGERVQHYSKIARPLQTLLSNQGDLYITLFA